MGVLKGDYIGFTIGNYHSSDLGIIRTSDGSRFNENLLPNFSDKTIKIPGRDETLYFRTEYDKKEFPISFAFDSLTESKFRLLKQVFGKKELQNLIFDEAPYKVYKVKVAAPPNIKYICFEENDERIYKGEGSVTFVAYYPFAKSRFKYKEDYNYTNIPEWKYAIDNMDEWLTASGIKGRNGFSNQNSDIPYGYFKCTKFIYIEQDSNLENYYEGNNGNITASDIEAEIENKNIRSFGGEYETRLYNPGDLNTPFKLKVNCSAFDYSLEYTIDLIVKSNDKIIGQLSIKDIPLSESGDYGFIVNSYNQLIEGIDEYGNKNNKILNSYISAGDFFKIPTTPYKNIKDLPILKIKIIIKSPDILLTKDDLTLLPSLNPNIQKLQQNELVYDFDYLYY